MNEGNPLTTKKAWDSRCNQTFTTKLKPNLNVALLVYPPPLASLVTAHHKHTHSSSHCHCPVHQPIYKLYRVGNLFLWLDTSMLEPFHGSAPGSWCHFVGAQKTRCNPDHPQHGNIRFGCVHAYACVLTMANTGGLRSSSLEPDQGCGCKPHPPWRPEPPPPPTIYSDLVLYLL